MSRIRIVSFLILSFHFSSFAVEAAPTKKALIFLVDQHFGLPEFKLNNRVVFSAITAFDSLRASYMASFINRIDDSDGYWSQIIAPVYDEVYYVIGDNCRNKNYMKNIWHHAEQNYDIIDYIALVHSIRDKPWFDPDWNITKRSGKIRFVYTSGCCSGNGAREIINEYGAVAAIGHRYDAELLSASPFYSFRVIEAWFSGKNLKETVEIGLIEGKANLESWWAKPILKMFNYPNSEAAIAASLLEYSHNAAIDRESLTIESELSELNKKNGFDEYGFKSY